MPRRRPPYPPEFRAEAVRLARAEGNSIRGVARNLGISGESLRAWIRQVDVDDGSEGRRTSSAPVTHPWPSAASARGRREATEVFAAWRRSACSPT